MFQRPHRKAVSSLLTARDFGGGERLKTPEKDDVVSSGTEDMQTLIEARATHATQAGKKRKKNLDLPAAEKVAQVDPGRIKAG